MIGRCSDHMTALTAKSPALTPAALLERDASGGAFPATGVVLIGTHESCRYLAGQLGQLAETTRGQTATCVPAGCVLMDRFERRDKSAGSSASFVPLPPILGHVDELISLHGRCQFRLALVCLGLDRDPSERVHLGQLLRQLGIPVRFVPTLEDMLGLCPGTRPPGRFGSGPHRGIIPLPPEAIDPMALIGRTPAIMDIAAVTPCITGKRVLITGAGGSIGAQLCSVVAALNPAQLIMVERAENALFTIDSAMARRHGSISRRAVLHDVVDAQQTMRMISEAAPDVIFHAAAHKHVPLMEDHASAALNNNFFGSKSVADAAIASGAERFVMISTDKAVNPTSVMGATKRLAELYVSSLDRQGGTRCSIVRFGNVLASACSVLPIWSQQLAEGSPISVTDPRMTRYFMTIPEAATLVVQAAALPSKPGSSPVYVLDMGEPIGILDLAIKFIRLHGCEARIRDGGAFIGHTDDEDAPDAATVDVAITGVRPGEKLHEELAYAAEHLEPTGHPKINRHTGTNLAGAAGKTTGGMDSAAAKAMAENLATYRSPAMANDQVIGAIGHYIPSLRRVHS